MHDALSADLPVEGAIVTVGRSSTPGEDQATVAVSDVHGEFSIAELPATRVTVFVQAPGFQTWTETVDLTGGPASIGVALRPVGETYHSSTVASSTQLPETASTTRLQARDIRSAPARSAEQILRQVPGLTLVQHGSEGKGYQYFLRGFDAAHGADIELRVGGVPVNEWSSVHAQGYLDIGFVIPELVRAVRVTKGPFTLDQGMFAAAGSVDFELSVPADGAGAQLRYQVGTTSRHRVFAAYAPAEAGGDSFVAVEATHDEGYGENRGLDRVSVNAGVVLQETGGRTTRALALFGLGRFGLPGTLRNDDIAGDRVGFYDTYEPRANGESTRGLLELETEWRRDDARLILESFVAARRLVLVENYTGDLLDSVFGDARRQSHASAAAGASLRGSLPLTAVVSLGAGGGVAGEWIDQEEFALDRELAAVATRRSLAGSQWRGDLRAGLRLQPHADLRVDAGGRADLMAVDVDDRVETGRSSAARGAVSPRVTATWGAHELVSLSAAYGRGFRPPEARAFSSFDPSAAGSVEEYAGTNPRVTFTDSGELGVRVGSDQLSAVLAGFATHIERESIFDHVSGVSIELNGTRRLGAEVVVAAAPAPWLSLEADATYVDARFSRSGNQVPFAPRFVSGVRASVDHPSGFRAGARLLVVAPRPLPHDATGATLVSADAVLGYDWRALRIALEVENLLNDRLREGEYHYASHWDATSPRSQLPVLHTSAGAPLNARLSVGVQL